MRRIFISIGVAALTIISCGAILLRLKGPSMLSIASAEMMYPHAPPMPAVVPMPAEDLLSQYEVFLKAKVPNVYAALQPGLTDSQIDVLEAAHGLNLPPDLRALYRWRNGSAPGVNTEAFPDHEFVPLDVALANRDALRKQVKAGSVAERAAYTAVAGHRDAWLGLIVDPAGDGHFFDPGRSESQGSFFFCFAEDGEYVFYPAFRNYLAAVVDGARAGVFTASATGVATADFAKAQNLWCRYGARSPR